MLARQLQYGLFSRHDSAIADKDLKLVGKTFICLEESGEERFEEMEDEMRYFSWLIAKDTRGFYAEILVL